MSIRSMKHLTATRWCLGMDVALAGNLELKEKVSCARNICICISAYFFVALGSCFRLWVAAPNLCASPHPRLSKSRLFCRLMPFLSISDLCP